MKAFRFLIVILALIVAGSGMSVDAKKRKTTKRRVNKAKVVEPAPTNYDYVQATTDGTDDKIYETVKYPPEYPGGSAGLIKFLSDNIQYPKNAMKNGVQGKVILQFVVEKDGSISNVEVLRSVDKELDAEAVRVVRQITRFVPGYNKDHAPLRVKYTLPVMFKL